MQFLPKQLRNLQFEYYVNQRLDLFHNNLQEFNDSRIGEKMSVNMKVKFAAYPDFLIFPTSRIDVANAKLLCKMRGDGDAKTFIDILVVPNFMLVIFFFLSILLGMIAAFEFVKDISNPAMGFLTALLLIITPAIYLYTGDMIQHLIKDRFVKYFDLQPVPEDRRN